MAKTGDVAATKVDVVVAHDERATLRVGDVFVKIDADQTRLDVEVQAMAMAPVPTPEILWRRPPALALAALRGRALGHLGDPSTASSAAWAAAGAAVRALHEAPLPPWPGRSVDDLASRLADECAWLVANDVLPMDVVTRNRRLAETVLRPWTPAFIHGDLQVDHVFVDGDEVTGVLDWSEASRGDALFDLATLTLGHPDHLDDVVAGYGTDVDRDLIRAWWSMRCLTNVRWLTEVGCYGPPEGFPEVALLTAQASGTDGHSSTPPVLGGRQFMGFVLITDASRAKAFYCDLLGLPLRHEDDVAVVVDAGGTPLRLAIVGAVPEPGGTNAGWLVDDVNAAVRDLIRAWWSMRCLTNVRWLTEVGCYGPPEGFPEVALLTAQTSGSDAPL